jgi:hypothetical protein
MPNHIENNVLIVATDELVKQIRDEIRGDENEIDSDTGERLCIDFDKINPLPKELVDTRSPTNIVSQEEYDKQEKQLVELRQKAEQFKDKLFNDLTDEERKIRNDLHYSSRSITQEMSLDFKQRFGYDNWYDWRLENNGTKWGAYSCLGGEHSENNFFFQTAWAHPIELMTALSKKYPEAIFVSTFADEDTGSNCGAIAYKDGEVEFADGSQRSHNSNFATAFALSVQYGEDVEQQVEMYLEDECFEKEDAEKIIKICNSNHQLIKIAQDLNEENAKFLTDMF